MRSSETLEEAAKGSLREDTSYKQNGSSPGEIFKYYKQFDDYWNVFPKTDFTYSPASKFYGKEIAPGIPVIPNLSRRALHDPVYFRRDVSYCGDNQVSWSHYLSWEKIVHTVTTIVTTVVTTTVTTVTTTVEEVASIVAHPKKSPCRTATLLLLLLLLPLLYYLFFLNTEETEDKSLFTKLNLDESSVFDSHFINVVKKPLVWLYWITGNFVFLITSAISIIPTILTQGFYTAVGFVTSLFQKPNMGLSPTVHQETMPPLPPPLPHPANIDPDEIRRIVHQILAEKDGETAKTMGVSDMKEIMREVMSEQDLKEKERLEQLVTQTKEIIISKQKSSMDNFMENIKEKFGHLEKSLEEQKEDLNVVKPQIQKLEEKLLNTQVELSSQTAALQRNDFSNTTTALAGTAIKQELAELVESTLAKYHADRTGKTDYALMSNGGQIVSIRCTQTYKKRMPKLTLFGFPLWDVYNSPETIIKPGTMPGECWAFEGSEGYVAIKLAIPIYVTGVTIEHTPKELTHHGHIQSAPNQFSVWGLKELMDENPEFLGRFNFLDSKGSLQTFDIKEQEIPLELIELRIESNHGNIEYTCLYRFRVHGSPTKLQVKNQEKRSN